MSHFVALCRKYPLFSFAVPELRPILKQQGRTKESTVVHFQNRVLDTRAMGYSEQEASVILRALQGMRQHRPLFGEDILVKEGEDHENERQHGKVGQGKNSHY